MPEEGAGSLRPGDEVLCERRLLPDGSRAWAVLRRLEDGWSVWREDDHGRRFEVRRTLSHEAAAALASELEAGVHKQAYWIEPTRRSPW